ncbi:MAG TPA: DUF2169 domain-containing protein [Vicinamibacterales bacterium]|nr:DUF2169 domain-containing protein [Vicinamibacterales bacterium]
MQLVNQTPVPARLSVSSVEIVPHRLGMLVAKATFRVGEGGRVQLDTQDPVPFYDGDELTEVGIRPRDDLPRHDPAFEVLLLGAAYGSNGQAVAERRVSLTVGTERRELLVTGDRRWIGRESISAPVPFVRMPMTVDRTFGGSCPVLVDDGAIMTVVHPPNRHGRGFDPEPAARALGEWLKAPEGYPQWNPERPLPNLEHPRRRVERYDDAPDPVCWSALPMDTLLHVQRGVVMPSGNPPTPDDPQVGSMLGTSWMKDGFFHRAHPDWVIDLPPAAATIEIDGVRPHGSIRFALPKLSVAADFTFGDVTGTRILQPQMLVLLPEEERFYLVYRRTFQLAPHSGIECSFRLRLENAWRTGQ